MGHELATSSGGAGFLVLEIVLYFVVTLGVWGSYKKAGPNGAPAWAAFIPIYNFIVLLKVAGRPRTWAWFLLLVIVPFIGSLALLVVAIIVLNDVSKSFGHGAGFTVGLVLLSFIFWYILWLGPSTYRGPAALAGSGGYGPGGPPMGGGYPPPGGYPQPGYPPAGQPPPPPGPPPMPPPPPGIGQPPPPPGQMPPAQ
jgi:hypothetical protein